jgi:hypothetical protein
MTKPPCHIEVRPIHDKKLYRFLGFETESQFLNRATINRVFCRVMRCGSCFIPKGSPLVTRLITATNLTIETKRSKLNATLPPEYAAFSSVFSEEASSCLPPSCPYDHTINLNNIFVPKIGKVYPLSPDEQKATEAFLEENLCSGKIRPSKSPQDSSFFIKKKDGKLRPCQDYRYLNSHTTRDAYPLPLISDLIDKLKGAKVFTKFDIRWGYNNVRIKDKDQWKGAFITHKGLFESTVMFFGMNNSPSTFQRFMNDSFRDMIAKGWLVIYMDDLLIFSFDDATHSEHTRCVLQRMTELDLHLCFEKYNFATTEVEYLGMIIKPGTLAMDPVKLDGIASWPTPTTVKNVRSFLSFANFYHHFIDHYSDIARPLIDLTKKDKPWDWSAAC